MNTPRRTPAAIRRRRRRSPARPTGLGLRRPAGTRSPARQHVVQARKKLDLTQLLTLGAVLVSLVFAIPQAINAQATLEATRDQNETDRQGQLTDRFSKAVEQLGSDKLQIRLGGIYALERIADDSKRDYPTVMNVLGTFVREETRALRPPQGGSCPNGDTAADMRAAVTVLAHPQPGRDRVPFEVPEACLPRVNFSDADLRYADLRYADLRYANLSDASLRGADLRGADLRGANLFDAHLSGVHLSDANLIGADLTGADLRGADLTDANLQGVRGWETILGHPRRGGP